MTTLISEHNRSVVKRIERMLLKWYTQFQNPVGSNEECKNWYSQLICSMLSTKKQLEASTICSGQAGSITPTPKLSFAVSWQRQLTWYTLLQKITKNEKGNS